MNVSKILSFGKTPIMTCQIKNINTKLKSSSTLYKLDASDESDISDVFYSKNARCLFPDMCIEQRLPIKSREFFVLQDDKSKEVISCAQTSHRYRNDSLKYPGLSTLIEEFNANPKYVNAAEPMFSCIAKLAEDRFDSSIVCAFYPDDDKIMKRAGFTKMKNGDWAIPQKRYANLIDAAERHSQIEYFV